MDVKQIVDFSKTQKFRGEWAEHEFNFEARSNLLTPKFLQQLMDMQGRPRAIAEALSEVIVWWDIEMGDEPFDPTTENLEILPMDFHAYLIERLAEVWQGNEQRPGASQNGSARSGRSGPRRPGSSK